MNEIPGMTPTTINTTPILLTPNIKETNLQKKNLTAPTKFSRDDDDEAEKDVESDISLQQTSSKRVEKDDEKINGKSLMEANKMESARIKAVVRS